MKTKYWCLWLILGIYLLFTGLGNISRIDTPIDMGISSFFIILGAISVYNAIKFRKLKKKGVKNTKKK